MSNPTCKQCSDTGRYKVIKYSGYYSPPTAKKVFCELCFRGKELRELEQKMKSPDYVNPFNNLTDEQIIWMINRSAEVDEPNRLISNKETT